MKAVLCVKSPEYWLELDDDLCCGLKGDRLNLGMITAFLAENADWLCPDYSVKICSDDEIVSC